MDHLERAKTNVKASHEAWQDVGAAYAAHLRELAIAHAVIALVEEVHEIRGAIDSIDGTACNLNENIKSINRSMLANRRI